MRSIVYKLLTDDAELVGLVPKANWHSSGALTEDNTPPTPFAVMRFGNAGPGMGAVQRGSVEIWIHDSLGSYQLIDRALARVRAILDGKEHVQDGDGNELMIAEYDQTSDDLYDPGFRTITKNSNFILVGTGI